MKQHGPLSLGKVLSDPAILPYFRSLSLTDQPRTRPEVPVPASQRKKHLILTLRLPTGFDAGATVPLVAAVFQLADVIAGAGGWGIGRGPGGRGGAGLTSSLRPETKLKLRQTRERLDKEIQEEAIREQKEEAEEKKAAAKRKAEEERLSKMSAAEQKKVRLYYATLFLSMLTLFAGTREGEEEVDA